MAAAPPQASGVGAGDTPSKPAATRSPMQLHCDFFDHNKDGIITLYDTYVGFRELGFPLPLAAWFAFLIHSTMSPFTNRSPLLLDPRLRIWTDKIRNVKHGSDTGVYDHEGEFVQQNFDAIWNRWDTDCDGKLSLRDILRMTRAQANVFDFFGILATLFEWTALWYMCHDKAGCISREQVRGMYD
eukprot:EG_transcript_34976